VNEFVGRTGPSADEVAVVTAAYLALSSSAPTAAAPLDVTPVWRFANRWYGPANRLGR
jgi:hypothetical protein